MFISFNWYWEGRINPYFHLEINVLYTSCNWNGRMNPSFLIPVEMLISYMSCHWIIKYMHLHLSYIFAELFHYNYYNSDYVSLSRIKNILQVDSGWLYCSNTLLTCSINIFYVKDKIAERKRMLFKTCEDF